MIAYDQVLYNVYVNHPREGVQLIGEGLNSENAVQLATKMFVDSKWKIDTQIVPVPAILYDKRSRKHAP
ncbi:MAG: hypothetical protein RL240_1688 [Planctomycetota bacterium]|jgi:hypothetical protein